MEEIEEMWEDILTSMLHGAVEHVHAELEYLWYLCDLMQLKREAKTEGIHVGCRG
jgi:hypothetical protein